MNNKVIWLQDCRRYGEGFFLLNRMKRFHLYYRYSLLCGPLGLLFRLLFKRAAKRRCIEISPETPVGGGLYLGHDWGITINPRARIGKNCNLHKGVTIGQENRGARKGVPIIGDEVWIGVKATVVGAVTVGDDVLIAPNSYVNCSIPSHSVVFGNPCQVRTRENATDGYINRKA